MRSAIICLVLACSLATSINKDFFSEAFKHVNVSSVKVPGFPMRSFNHPENEDVKYCGSYESWCFPKKQLSTRFSMKLVGMMHHDPVYMALSTNEYISENCQDYFAVTTTINTPVKFVDSNEQHMAITYEKILINFRMKEVLEALTCTEPLELNTDYDITTISCKDGMGNDFFYDLKQFLGKTVEVEVEFGEKTATYDGLPFDRMSDTGCTCASELLKKSVSMLPKAMPKAEAKNEDIKFCGRYSTGCVSSPMVSMQADMKILGMMHKNPIYMQYPVAMYLGEQCTEATEIMLVTVSAPLQVKNDVDKTVTVTPDKVLVRFVNEMMISGYKCTEPLEVNKDYDVTTLDCKDEEGNDPFADMKAQIGVPVDTEMSFGEKSLSLKDESGEALVLERLGDEGCTCYKNLRA